MKLGASRGGLLWYMVVLPKRLRNKKMALLKSYVNYRQTKKDLSIKLEGKQLRKDAVTIVITSAGRQEYLQQTIESLKGHFIYDQKKTVWYIIDDFPDSIETREYIESLPIFDLKIFNPVNMGLGYSLNRIYSEINTEFVFHCEDDWLFLQPVPVSRMIKLLRENPHLRQLTLHSGSVKPKFENKVKLTDKGFAETHFKTFTFNPHLALTNLFIQNQPFPLMYSELEYTLKLERAGRSISGIIDYGSEIIYVQHLGFQRRAVKY